MFIYTHIRDTEIRDTPLPHFPHINGGGYFKPQAKYPAGFFVCGSMGRFWKEKVYIITTILKYLKYYIPGLTGILFIVMLLMGENFPTYFLIGFSIFIIVGVIIFPKDNEIQLISFPNILNLSI